MIWLDTQRGVSIAEFGAQGEDSAVSPAGDLNCCIATVLTNFCGNNFFETFVCDHHIAIMLLHLVFPGDL
ncbi:MAG: hypothetical protein ABGY96_07225 [bacterium]|nr:hypothetical protein [Gammaproteobacteria bacterium]